MLSKLVRHLRRNVIAYLALFFSLAGTSFAAARIIVPPNSVGKKQLKKNAVTSIKVKDNSLTGRDIAEGRLGQVPNAAHADTAGAAKSAAVAGSAVNAVNASFLGGVNATGFVRTAQPAGGDLTGLYPSPTIANGAITASKLAPAEAWHDASFYWPSLWGNWGAGTNPVGYLKDQLGFVHLRGMAKNISGSPVAAGCGAVDNGVLFVLPPGYRPANEERFADVNSDSFGFVDVTQGGTVCSDVSTATSGYATLDGITFRAAS